MTKPEINSALASVPAPSGAESVATRLKRRIDYRLNDALCEMKPEHDDSITGFNGAWDIVSRILNEEIGIAVPRPSPSGADAMTDAQILQWINACNHEPAREALRHYLALRSAPQAVPAEDIAGLVERLNAATMRTDWNNLPDDACIPAVPLLREAAAALTSLSAERDHLAKPKGFLLNCYLKPKDGETAMFAEYGDGRIVVQLDGYAIIPMDDYKASEAEASDLRRKLEEHRKAARLPLAGQPLGDRSVVHCRAAQYRRGDAMRVLVCGGRDFRDTSFAHRELDRLRKEYGFDCVIEGDAPGADRIAGYWARKHRLDNLKFPADWDAHGRAAGPIRNQRMIDEGKPDLVIALPGGRGTADMVARARTANIPVIEMRP